jgi:hypothetical protein
MLGICRACDGKCQRHFPSILGIFRENSVRNSVTCQEKSETLSVTTMEHFVFHTVEGNSFPLLRKKIIFSSSVENVIFHISKEFPEREGMKFLRFLGKGKAFSVGC